MNASNTRALKFYLKFGFTVQDFDGDDEAGEPPEDTLIMARTLWAVPNLFTYHLWQCPHNVPIIAKSDDVVCIHVVFGGALMSMFM